MTNLLPGDLISILKLTSGDNLESIVAKLQSQVNNAILSIKNGYQLCIFTKKEEIPLALEYTGKRNEIYYFRSLVDAANYAIFGSHAASIFLPNLFRYENVIASIDHNGVISTATTSVKERAKIQPIVLNFVDSKS